MISDPGGTTATRRALLDRLGAVDPGRLSFPPVERPALGGDAIVAHMPGAPIGVVMLLWRPGVLAEPEQAEGATALAMRLLREGGGRRSAEDSAAAMDALGARWLGEVEWDSVKVGVSAPVESLVDATNLLVDALVSPVLTDANVERLRDQQITALRSSASSAVTRGRTVLDQVMCGLGCRLGTPLRGTEQSLAGLDLEVVRELCRDLLSRQATLIVCGDLDALDLDAVARSVFDRLAPGAAREASARCGEPAPRSDILLVPGRGDGQAGVHVGHKLAVGRSSGDYVALRLLETVFGGSVDSRLNRRLREQLGLTYRTSANFEFLKRGSSIRIACTSEASGAATVVQEVIGEMEKMCSPGVDEAEVTAAKRYRAGLLATQFETPEVVAMGLATIAVHGFPEDYFTAQHSELLSLGSAELNAAARTHLVPAHAVVVVEGDPGTLLPVLSGAWDVRVMG